MGSNNLAAIKRARAARNSCDICHAAPAVYFAEQGYTKRNERRCADCEAWLRCNSSKRALPLRVFVQVLSDDGINPAAISRRVRNAQRRALPKGK